MKITKARLKEIIKEELANLDEAMSGMTGTVDDERRMSFAGDDPLASIARRRQGKELRRLAKMKREDSPEVANAKEKLADMGILNLGKGDMLMRGKSIRDAEQALKDMGADSKTLSTIVDQLEAFYR